MSLAGDKTGSASGTSFCLVVFLGMPGLQRKKKLGSGPDNGGEDWPDSGGRTVRGVSGVSGVSASVRFPCPGGG